MCQICDDSNMAMRIDEYVIGGELNNTSRNSVVGFLEFAPDWGVRIEVGGNLSGELAGRRFRFQVREASLRHPGLLPGEFPEHIEAFDHQFGVIGQCVFRVRKIPTIPVHEFLQLPREQKRHHIVHRDCLYLEWFGPNGRVVAEVADVEIEFLDSERSAPPIAEPLPNEDDVPSAPEITMVSDDGIERIEFPQPESDEDPYGLFDENLESAIQSSLGNESEFADQTEDKFDESGRRERSWEEVIPGIDPETKALYEQWDEVLHGPQDLAASLFAPLQLPHVEQVTTDSQAWPLVSTIMARLATVSIAFDLCEHATPLSAYRCLIEDILPIASVSPNAGAAGFVAHYSMYESCKQCEAEFDEEYDRRS